MTTDESPFHRGERDIQTRYGLRDKMERFGRMVIRDHLPQQHRDFYAQLPYLAAGTVDAQGRPWPSLLVGEPGFASAPDERTLRVKVRPLAGDPLAQNLEDGAPVGVLGIEMATRRRNRLGGRLANTSAEGFDIAIEQAFGNCPQYIQSRTHRRASAEELGDGRVVLTRDGLEPAMREMVARSDTFFIASVHDADASTPAHGADVSHRGGRPGFVKVDEAGRTLSFPDFPGNGHFNTLGNLTLNPSVGLLFVDFERGDMLYLAGRAEVDFDGPDIATFRGAERIVHVAVEEARFVPRVFPLRFRQGEASPNNALTGTWQEKEARVEAERRAQTFRTFEVVRVDDETDEVRSFRLRPKDGAGLSPYVPGQFLPIRVCVPGEARPLVRTYSLSTRFDPEGYRISVKREPGGRVSNYLHDHVVVGSTLEALAPRGDFVLDEESERPVLLLSAGIGVTPMVAMLDHLVAEMLRLRKARAVLFLHGARDRRRHAFADYVRRVVTHVPEVKSLTAYSEAGPEDRPGVDYQLTGYFDAEVLRRALPLDDYDVYLCGPPPFMEGVYAALRELGVARSRIHYEAFGPATVLGADEEPESEATAAAGPPPAPAEVQLTEAGPSVTWTPGDGTLLELAEANGVDAPFGCRTGLCGACSVELVEGSVTYTTKPKVSPPAGEVLTCCSRPQGPVRLRIP